MKKEIYLEYERKEMRGSSDQTAMNNKHIKRFHFSISPPRSIRSGAVERSWFIFFRSNHCISKPSPPAQLCLDCCHRRTITFVIFSTTTTVRWENVGFFFLQILSFVISPSAPSFSSVVSLLPSNLITVPLACTSNPPSLPTSYIFAIPNYFDSMAKAGTKSWYQVKSNIKRDWGHLSPCNTSWQAQTTAEIPEQILEGSKISQKHLPQRSTYKQQVFVWWSPSVYHHTPVACICVLWGWLATLQMGVCDTLQRVVPVIL